MSLSNLFVFVGVVVRKCGLRVFIYQMLVYIGLFVCFCSCENET